MPQCNSVRRKCSNISFYKFPQDKSLLKEWKIKLRIGKEVGTSGGGVQTDGMQATYEHGMMTTIDILKIKLISGKIEFC